MKNVELEYDKMKDMWNKAQGILEEQVMPRVLVGGKTGVGKSSVLNAILGKNVYETGVIPTSHSNSEEIWKSTTGGEIVVIDVPGFGEADAPEMSSEDGKITYEENIRRLAELSAHIFILVLKADDRALQIEQDFLSEWNKNPALKDLPVLIVINQIDKVKPLREWDPASLDLQTPRTEKEKNIRQYVDYVSSIPIFSPYAMQGRIISISAGEEYNDPLQYKIAELRMKIYETLPDAIKTIFARAAELHKIEAKRIIKYYAGSCASVVLMNFLPASDAILLAPFQIAMIIHLGKLNNIEITMSGASAILSSLGVSLAGRFVAQQLISIFPFIKNVVGPPLAFGLTYTMGLTVNELFMRGKVRATKEEIDNIASQFVTEGEEAMATRSE